jgi:hypothetical protein
MYSSLYLVMMVATLLQVGEMGLEREDMRQKISVFIKVADGHVKVPSTIKPTGSKSWCVCSWRDIVMMR